MRCITEYLVSIRRTLVTFTGSVRKSSTIQRLRQPTMRVSQAIDLRKIEYEVVEIVFYVHHLEFLYPL